MAKKSITVGSRVKWHDPAINDYSPADRKVMKKNVYIVHEISEEDAWIYDETLEPAAAIQVAPWELELVDSKNSKRNTTKPATRRQ